MKRAAALAALLLLVTGTMAAAEIRGAWTAEAQADGSLQMNLTSRNNNHGESMPLNDFTGLSSTAIDAATQTPVTFELRREAGNVAFEGTFKGGFGAGQFTFTPSPDYRATLRSLGVTFEDTDRDEDRELMTMALLDVSTAYIRSMQAEGYRQSAETYLKMRVFRITPEYVRDMRASGYKTLSADELVTSRIHRATPEFVREIAGLGYRDLAFDDLIAFRIHRVTPELIRDLRDLGYTDIPADQLVAMSIHRVTPEFIREMKDAGYEHVPVEKLISMRIHGIDATFVKKMNRSQ
ncbi:MAG TPA: hypothetical protein VLV78_01760 [Thermoanaerobaculia bacterium]|nr:hypothetical protein [Thermoanaerobaculia bacterium]